MTFVGPLRPRRLTCWLAASSALLFVLAPRAEASLIGDEVRIQISVVDTTFTVVEDPATPDFSYSSFNWNVDTASVVFWINNIPGGTLGPGVTFTLSDLDFSPPNVLAGATIVSSKGLFVDVTDDILTVGDDFIVVDLSTFAGGDLGGIDSFEIQLQVPVCPDAPDPTCVAAGKGKLKINERKAGKERLKASIQKISAATEPSDFGDPVSVATAYYTCIYDGADALVAELAVARAGDTCGPKAKPCWRDTKSGYQFLDPDAASDGMKKMVIRSGGAGKGKITLAAGNNEKKNQDRLPLSITAALAGTSGATLQVRNNHGHCFGLPLTARQAESDAFVAK